VREPVRLTRLLLADPYSVFRLGVKSILREERDFDVVEAGSLREAEEHLERGLRPDLALIDLDLPPRGALDALALLRGTGTPTIVWSQRERLSPETVFDIVRCGAIGLLCKEMSAVGLVRSLRGVARGEAPVGREIVSMLIEGMQTANDRVRARSQIGTLSSRERQVLELVSEGRSNKQIAAELFVSEFTAKRHVQNILRKLGVHSRWEASASYHSYLAQAPSPSARRLAGVAVRR
jgi:DNA-binding NarL/FixJ family response regulator